MWGGKPVDGFAIVVCWIRGHDWPVESGERDSDADAVRCRRCNGKRSTGKRGPETPPDAG